MRFLEKKRVILPVIVLSFILITSFADAGVNLEFSLLNQSPGPAQPGDTVTVRLKVENTGTDELKDVTAVISAGGALSVIGNDSKYIGTITPSNDVADYVALKFDLKVDPSAANGDHEFRLTLDSSTTDFFHDFTLEVEEFDPIVQISNITTEPGQLEPGKETRVVVEVQNSADSATRDIKLEFDFNNSDVPFIPSRLSSSQSVPILPAGGSANLTYWVLTLPDTSPGAYRVPFTLTYRDNSNQLIERSDIIAFVVGAAPDIQVTIDSTEVITSGDTGEVSFRFSNKGISDIRFLNVEIGDADGIRVIGPDRVYVGDVDSDDFETAEFILNIKSGKGEVSVPLTMTYRDANNNEHMVVADVPLKIYSDLEARRLGLKDSGSPTLIGILVILAVAGAIYWRRRKKKLTGN